MDERVVIERRFNGPRDFGNGGYVAGVLAGFLEGPVEATLRKPIPLETPFRLARAGDGVELRHGGALVAEARPASLELEAPRPPAFEDARAAAAGYLGWGIEDYAHCFVCGTKRPASDGLRVFAARLGDDGLVAGAWAPGAAWADESGYIKSAFLWSALDCPGSYALMGDAYRPMALGRMTARIEARPRPGERLVVVGWPLPREGRKQFSGTALFAEGGRLLALGRATWFDL